MNIDHYHRLSQMFVNAPINKLYKPEINISDGECTIELPPSPDFFHAGKTLHGSVYFKMLDDAAYFAIQSQVTDYFILTSSFSIHFIRPIGLEKITAKGTIISRTKSVYTGEAKLYNEAGKLVGHGSGSFMKSSLAIEQAEGY